MQVTGIQPVGARGPATVQPLVADPRGAGAAPADAPRATRAASPTFVAEAVTFPRDGLPVDHRPLDLRRARAAARYREAQELAARGRPHRPPR
ncbi:MAG: hypothetical protein KatS3mg009_2217 [Acidimicrobiia bacterium]|nr:MAG: hypothetical protein KatS3mg009_2217 [Acidimicrobiia bacterium]